MDESPNLSLCFTFNDHRITARTATSLPNVRGVSSWVVEKPTVSKRVNFVALQFMLVPYAASFPKLAPRIGSHRSTTKDQILTAEDTAYCRILMRPHLKPRKAALHFELYVLSSGTSWRRVQQIVQQINWQPLSFGFFQLIHILYNTIKWKWVHGERSPAWRDATSFCLRLIFENSPRLLRCAVKTQTNFYRWAWWILRVW